MSALAYDAMNETYHDFEKLVYHTCHQFARRYGGDIDELISHGNEIFIRAYKTYDKESGKFSSWLRLIIWKQLLEKVRRDAMRNARLPRVTMELRHVPEATHQDPFNFKEYVKELGLSEDAKIVVKLVVDTPKDIIHSLRERGRETPTSYKASIREFLKDLGWTSKRITESFHEISQALQ